MSGSAGTCMIRRRQKTATWSHQKRRGSVDLMAPVGLAGQIDGSGSDGRSWSDGGS